MDWTYSVIQNTYIADHDPYRCRVHHGRSGRWTAIVIHEATVSRGEDFATAEAAMAWCEEYVRQASP